MENLKLKREKISQITKIGLSYVGDERFICLRLVKKQGNNHLFAEVKQKNTGKKKVVRVDGLKHGYNPFRQTPEKHEENIVQPVIQKALKSWGLTTTKEVYLSRKSRLDFLCTNKKGRKIIIEVKSDKKRHSSKDLTEQLSRYRVEGKKKFGNAYAGTFLVSIKGRYGYSLDELRMILKAKGLI